MARVIAAVLANMKRTKSSPTRHWFGPEQTNYRCENALNVSSSGLRLMMKVQNPGATTTNFCLRVAPLHCTKYVNGLFLRNLAELTLREMVSSPFALRNDSMWHWSVAKPKPQSLPHFWPSSCRAPALWCSHMGSLTERCVCECVCELYVWSDVYVLMSCACTTSGHTCGIARMHVHSMFHVLVTFTLWFEHLTRNRCLIYLFFWPYSRALWRMV